MDILSSLPPGSQTECDRQTLCLSLRVPHLDWDLSSVIYKAAAEGYKIVQIYRIWAGREMLIYSMPVREMIAATGPRILHDADIVTLAHSAAIAGETWSLVRHETHEGVFTINSGIYTGVAPSRWKGQDMANYWDGPALRAYCEALDRHKFLGQHQWTAYRMNQGREKIDLVGNVDLVLYRGEPHRLVQTLLCEAA
jgi:hypothetical protein